MQAGLVLYVVAYEESVASYLAIYPVRAEGELPDLQIPLEFTVEAVDLD